MGSHWSRAACSNQVQNRLARVVAPWAWLGRDPACEYSKQVERKRANHELPASLRIRSKVETKSCSWGAASPWVLWWRRENVRCSHFPQLLWELMNGSYKCVTALIKSFVVPLKKKSAPTLELMGCLTLTRMYYTCRTSLQFAKYPKFQKNLLGGLLYRLLLDKVLITNV